ncbi:hypothetical protein [Pilimelia anulata]|uniref:hypothetical protein n=1 Tax=Pilimelia anulata TaxID=53371 RepID=UPI00166E84AC|nr:hypothetical protein [Pilimelia anulata]
MVRIGWWVALAGVVAAPAPAVAAGPAGEGLPEQPFRLVADGQCLSVGRLPGGQYAAALRPCGPDRTQHWRGVGGHLANVGVNACVVDPPAARADGEGVGLRRTCGDRNVPWMRMSLADGHLRGDSVPLGARCVYLDRFMDTMIIGRWHTDCARAATFTPQPLPPDPTPSAGR